MTGHSRRLKAETASDVQAYTSAFRRYQNARAAWWAARIWEAADALGWQPSEVTPLVVGFASAWYGKPDPLDRGPQLADYLADGS
jgi:hypothetical protein